MQRGEYMEMAGVFFLQAMATSMWFVPFTVVLDAHGLHAIKPYAFATTAAATFLSPLLFGAIADRHASPVRVLRWLALATAAAIVATNLGIHLGWNAWVVLGLVQVLALCSSPTTSLSNAIVFARLRNSQRDFGRVRAMGTFGWICGCWIISAMNADASVRAGYAAAAVWLLLAAFSLMLPGQEPPRSHEHLTWRQRMGWDALTLLKNHDHKVVFITIALFSIPLAAFYPFTPPQLLDLGLRHTSAWMTLGQATEFLAMLALAWVLGRWRLKWIFTVGLAFGLLRYVLYAVGGRAWVLAGVSLHGLSLTLFFITAQIYVDERVDPAWRARAQALVFLMMSGVGNLVGYIGTGWWFNGCTDAGHTRWSVFWSGLAAAIVLVLVYFVTAYHGKPFQRRSDKTAEKCAEM